MHTLHRMCVLLFINTQEHRGHIYSVYHNIIRIVEKLPQDGFLKK